MLDRYHRILVQGGTVDGRRRFMLIVLAFLLAGFSWIRSLAAPDVPSTRVLRSLGAIEPRISPSGRFIAASFQGAIWRIDRTGGPFRRMTDRGGFDSGVAWSPDSKRIVYVNGADKELQLMDAESAVPVTLPARILAEGKFFFHPNGQELFGNFSATEKRPVFGKLDLVTGTIQSLLQPAQGLQPFCVSPVGEQIAYSRSLDTEGEQSGNQGPEVDIYVLPARGGNPKRLTRFPSRIYSLWWFGENLFASSSLGGAHNDLWMIPLNQPDKPRRLTSGQADEENPSISSDGRWLCYTDNRENATTIMVRDLVSGEEKVVAPSTLDFGAKVGTIRLEILDKGTGKPLTARVSLRQVDGKYFAPPGSLYRILGDLQHFYCAGQTSFTVPAGKYILRVFRGIEYRENERHLEVSADRSTEMKVELERWVNPQQNSWFGGESHIHANYGYGEWYNTPETMRLQIEGEGLNVGNFMVANSDTDGVFDREFFRGAPDPESADDTILYWNEEFRATHWGHMTLLNLRHLVEPFFTGFPDTTNPWDIPTNSDVADITHLQGGHVNFTHPAANVADPFLSAYSAKSLPVDVALGKIDSLDIDGSSGGQQGYQATVPLWYRLLNCGFRMPASAGTDCFLNRMRSRLPGSDRVYVKIDGALSYPKWIEGLRKGRSFVTNGPMLEFTGNSRFLGETLRFEKEGRVRAKARAIALFPLKAMELVYNGSVVATGNLSSDGLTGSIDDDVAANRSGWLSVRAFGEKGEQAHTSPIYIEVSGQPTMSREDAEYFVHWIDRLEEKLNARRRLPSAEIGQRVQSQINAARAVYSAIVASSRE